MEPKLEQEIKDIKSSRVAGDAVIQMIKSIGTPTRERSLAITKFQEGVMWLGMDLKRVHDTNAADCPNPYINSKDPSNTIIEPTADGLKL